MKKLAWKRGHGNKVAISSFRLNKSAEFASNMHLDVLMYYHHNVSVFNMVTDGNASTEMRLLGKHAKV